MYVSSINPVKLFLIGVLSLFSLNAQEAAISVEDARNIAKEAYIYGYPLVTMELTRKVSTNVEKPIGNRAPVGQFANMRTYPDAEFNLVTAPNADTLYSAAWIDLSKEPIVLHVPDEHGRYFLMPILSGWTDVFADPGTRTTGTGEANYVITGPNWKGTLPPALKEYKSPTNMTWIIGRTYSSGTPEDYKIVHYIQDQYQLTPLSYFGKTYEYPKGIVDPNIDMKTSVRDQVNQLSAEAFFNQLTSLMIDNPPSAADAPIIEKMAKIGINPGQAFQISSDPKIANAIKQVPAIAQKAIMAQEKEGGKNINGWLFSLETGKYGINYLQRAFIAAFGLGANLPQDAVYPVTSVDSNGKQLNGANKYVIHFDKGEEPPVRGFWSITMYNDKVFFAANSLNRYSLNSSSPLIRNQDGSLDIYIQNESPGADKEANWLPAPKDNFILMLRTYWPEKPILDGSWTPPGVIDATPKEATW